MEIVQFAWSLLSGPTHSGVRHLRRERRQTAIKIRSLSLSLSLSSRDPSGDTTADTPPSRFSDRFVESGFEFRSGLRNPRASAPTRRRATQSSLLGPDGHFKTNTRLSRTRKIAGEEIFLSLSSLFIPALHLLIASLDIPRSFAHRDTRLQTGMRDVLL